MRYLIFLLLINMVACQIDTKQYKINPSLSSSRDKTFTKYYKQKNSLGLAFLKYDFHDNTDFYSPDSSLTLFDFEKSKDTLIMYFEFNNLAYLTLKIFDGYYNDDIYYSTDIRNTYPDGYDEGTYMEPLIFSSSLELKKKYKQQGDTIVGKYDCETFPFRIGNNKKADKYYIYFSFITP